MDNDQLTNNYTPPQTEQADDDAIINDLISFLDSSVTKGVGHINVGTDEASAEIRTVETLGCSDCGKGNLACHIPNLSTGMEDA